LVAAVVLFLGSASHGSEARGCVGEALESGESVVPGCAPGRGLEAPFGIVVSPDGKSAYVASEESNSVAMLQREPATGELSQPQSRAACIAQGHAAKRECTSGRGLEFATDVAISPDGKSVYVVSGDSDALAIFDRDPVTGVLKQMQGTLGCIAQAAQAGACGDGEALEDPSSVLVSPDGKNVYVGATGIAVFRRDPGTGALVQEKGGDGCHAEENRGGSCQFALATDLAISPDGKDLYATSPTGEAVVIFKRDPRTGVLKQLPGEEGCISRNGENGACGKSHALDGADHITVSPDGANVYVSAQFSGSVAIFDRDRNTGALTQKPEMAGCVSRSGSGGTCQSGRGLVDPGSIALSPDGSNVYVLSAFSGGLAVFDRRPGGGLSQLAGTAGCISGVEEHGCGNMTSFGVPSDLTVSPDGKNVYFLDSAAAGSVLTMGRSASTGALSPR